MSSRAGAPELRRDALSGRLAVIAPARGLRPGALVRPEAERDDERQGCPFCEGRESATPSEAFALGASGRAPDAPGWRIRVVPNKFPAFLPATATGQHPRDGLFESRAAAGRQEVVVHSPRHVVSFADLAGREIADVAAAWRARAGEARDAGHAYVQALLNEGRSAGASIAHSHSQLVWLDREPPAVDRERAEGARAAGCLLCLVLAEERAHGTRVVDEQDGVVALCPWASRAPYELLVAPAGCEPDAFASSRLETALFLLSSAIHRLRLLEGRVPLNAWLHTCAFGRADGHWHLELVPRLTVQAGLELGAEVYVNPLPPEQAAETLRAP